VLAPRECKRNQARHGGPLICGIDVNREPAYISSYDEVTTGDSNVRDFELALKAVGDPTRTRILKLLERGGLCVCQVQAVLGLAPSTVSKHLTILKLAGLVEDQRDGKWIEYRLTHESRNPHAEAVLTLLRGPLDRDPAVVSDRKRLREIKAIPMTELCSLPAARVPMPERLVRPRRTRSAHVHG
jgi:arsenate reductase/ArsR family transcriptional regulator